MAIAIEESSRPVDRCPYQRLFSHDFNGCPAFAGTDYTPLDLQYRPLRTIAVCRHLEAGSASGGRFYPKCRLGDVEGRTRWVQQVGLAELERIRSVSLDYRHWAGDRGARLWELKGRWLASLDLADEPVTELARRELELAVKGFLRDADEWVDRESEQLVSAGMSPEALKALLDAALNDWARSRTVSAAYVVPESILNRFAPNIRAFIRAGSNGEDAP